MAHFEFEWEHCTFFTQNYDEVQMPEYLCEWHQFWFIHSLRSYFGIVRWWFGKCRFLMLRPLFCENAMNSSSTNAINFLQSSGFYSNSLISFWLSPNDHLSHAHLFGLPMKNNARLIVIDSSLSLILQPATVLLPFHWDNDKWTNSFEHSFYCKLIRM